MSEYPAAKPTIDLTAIRREAVAAESARIREGVEGLRGFEASGRLVKDPMGHWVEYAAVLALLEDKP